MENITFNSPTICLYSADSHTLLPVTQTVNSKTSEVAKSLLSSNNTLSFFSPSKKLFVLVGAVALISTFKLLSNPELPKQKVQNSALLSARAVYNALLIKINSGRNTHKETMQLPQAAKNVFQALIDTGCELREKIEAAKNVVKAYSFAIKINQGSFHAQNLQNGLDDFLETNKELNISPATKESTSREHHKANAVKKPHSKTLTWQPLNKQNETGLGHESGKLKI